MFFIGKVLYIGRCHAMGKSLSLKGTGLMELFFHSPQLLVCLEGENLLAYIEIMNVFLQITSFNAYLQKINVNGGMVYRGGKVIMD